MLFIDYSQVINTNCVAFSIVQMLFLTRWFHRLVGVKKAKVASPIDRCYGFQYVFLSLMQLLFRTHLQSQTRRSTNLQVRWFKRRSSAQEMPSGTRWRNNTKWSKTMQKTPIFIVQSSIRGWVTALGLPLNGYRFAKRSHTGHETRVAESNIDLSLVIARPLAAHFDCHFALVKRRAKGIQKRMFLLKEPDCSRKEMGK